MNRKIDGSAAPLTNLVSTYIAEALDRDLPDDVADRAKKHILDGLIAVVSGATLPPGRYARAFVARRSAAGDSTVVGSDIRTCPEHAALANGMSAHADETDDTNDLARMHPGASIIPAALAVAEDRDRPGAEFLRAVVAGYDVGCAFPLAVWEPGRVLRQSVQSSHGVGQLFGAMAGAGALANLSVEQLHYVVSYTAQQVSGLSSMFRDTEHIEKAFGMGGKQAHNGVLSVEMVSMGFTGVGDVLDKSPTLFDAWGTGGDPGRIATRLGGRSEVMNSDIKRYPVGMPIQAAAQALEELVARHRISADDVHSVVCRLPTEKAHIVDNKPMPDINLQYVLAVVLADGGIGFPAAHDYGRLRSPAIQERLRTIELVHDPRLDAPATGDGATRRAVIELDLVDGRKFEHRVDHPLGTRANPMSWESMERKAREVLGDVLDAEQVDGLVRSVMSLETVSRVRDLRPFLTARRPGP